MNLQIALGKKYICIVSMNFFQWISIYFQNPTFTKQFRYQ